MNNEIKFKPHELEFNVRNLVFCDCKERQRCPYVTFEIVIIPEFKGKKVFEILSAIRHRLWNKTEEDSDFEIIIKRCKKK